MPRHPLYIQVHILVYILMHQQQPVHYMMIHMVYLVAVTLPTYNDILDVERVAYAYDGCMMMQRSCSLSILYDIISNNNNNIHIPGWWGEEFTIRVPQTRVVRAD